jgi:hypothetical protein
VGRKLTGKTWASVRMMPQVITAMMQAAKREGKDRSEKIEELCVNYLRRKHPDLLNQPLAQDHKDVAILRTDPHLPEQEQGSNVNP